MKTDLARRIGDKPIGSDRPTVYLPQDDSAARALLTKAHSRMYKWPIGYLGYKATVTVNDAGCLVHGHATVNPRLHTVVRVDGEPMLQESVHERLWSQAMHLIWTSFEEGDGRYVLTFGENRTHQANHPRGTLVTLHDGRLASWYRIKDDAYAQISRGMPDRERRINTIERYEASSDGRLYVSHFVTARFADDGDTSIGMESYVNEFITHQRVLLPSGPKYFARGRRVGEDTRHRIVRSSSDRLMPCSSWRRRCAEALVMRRDESSSDAYEGVHRPFSTERTVMTIIAKVFGLYFFVLVSMLTATGAYAVTSEFYVAVDELTTIASGTYAGLANPNYNHLTYLRGHIEPDPTTNHFHGIGSYSYTGPAGSQSIIWTNANNRIPETSTGQPPLPLVAGIGAYAGLLVSDAIPGLEYSDLTIHSVELLNGFPAGAPEHYLYNSSGGRWNGSLAGAQVGLQLISLTAGLRINNELGHPILNSVGDVYVLGAGHSLAFTPTFWTEGTAPSGTYSAQFRLVDLGSDMGRSPFAPSGTFNIDFQVVPEPSTATLFALGIGVLGIPAIRRHPHWPQPVRVRIRMVSRRGNTGPSDALTKVERF
ncbi:all3515 family Zur-repressed PEP-CTERM protein [Nitrospira sp. Nam74]